MTLLSLIQKGLEFFYPSPFDLRVEDFLVPPKNVGPTERDEILFFKEERTSFEIGLYLNPRILRVLGDHPPWERLTPMNLDPFCAAVEGVSHFLFILTRVTEQRPVSQLELELQAEVDKYLLCSLLLHRQRKSFAVPLLRQALFDDYSLLKELRPEEEIRYHLANRLAYQYCGRLDKMAHPLKRPDLIREARRFHQLGLQGKIHWLTNRESQITLGA